jgi:hypothetical protein
MHVEAVCAVLVWPVRGQVQALRGLEEALSVHRRVLVQAVRLTIEVVGFLLEAVSVPQKSLENVEDSMKIYLGCVMVLVQLG